MSPREGEITVVSPDNSRSRGGISSLFSEKTGMVFLVLDEDTACGIAGVFLVYFIKRNRNDRSTLDEDFIIRTVTNSGPSEFEKCDQLQRSYTALRNQCHSIVSRDIYVPPHRPLPLLRNLTFSKREANPPARRPSLIKLSHSVVNVVM